MQRKMSHNQLPPRQLVPTLCVGMHSAPLCGAGRRAWERGFTLIELTVVLLILIALAGLALPYVSGTSQAALCRATDVTMQNVKKVIMERYYLDTLGYFPKDTKDTTDNHDLKYLFEKPSDPAWQSFDIDSQTGWRGPYLQSGVDNQVLDGWGRAIDIQVLNNADCIDPSKWGITTDEAFCARMVSAGQGSGLGASDATIDTAADGHLSGDDRVLYLNVPTPTADINSACDS